MKLFIGIVVLCVAGVVYVQSKHESPRSLHELSKRGWCRELNESCWGFPKCCGTLQCYYSGGYSTGRCIECVPQGWNCLFDTNCCWGLQCDKGGDLDVSGACEPPRAEGEQCWEDSQCATTFCDDVILGPGSGRCRPRYP